MAKRAIPKKVKNEIDEYVQALKEDHLPIVKVILFGSYAKGKQRKGSDIDLCIISPKFKNSFKAMQYLWAKRLNDSGVTIEPIGFSSEDFRDESTLTREIKQTDIEIH